MKKLTTISDVRLFFHRNERPIYFISATNFNLAGIDERVQHFKYINYIDCFDGRHPNVFVPKEAPHEEFESIEDINNYLLEHKEVVDYIEGRGGKPVATFLMFDEKTEALCKELGIEVWFPPAGLRNRCDNKMETVRIGNKAGVPSVPNALSRVESYAHLRKITGEAGIGDDLVIQTAFGDSGHTTFFIASEADWAKHAEEIVGESEVKIMKRINCRGATLEACVTRCGTIVGPLLTEIVGQKELTPYKGGWCGNEVFPGAFSEGVRARAREMAFKFGNQLWQEGYRGYFDLDFLVDQDSGQVYLGELNPRVCGASPMTNHAARVLGTGVRSRRRSAQRALGGSRLHRRLEPDRHQAHPDERRHRDAGSAVRHLEAGRRWHGVLPPLRLPSRRRGDGARSVFSAHHGGRRLPLRGRRPRHPDYARPINDRRFQVERARAPLDQGAHVLLLRQAVGGGSGARGPSGRRVQDSVGFRVPPNQ